MVVVTAYINPAAIIRKKFNKSNENPSKQLLSIGNNSTIPHTENAP